MKTKYYVWKTHNLFNGYSVCNGSVPEHIADDLTEEKAKMIVGLLNNLEEIKERAVKANTQSHHELKQMRGGRNMMKLRDDFPFNYKNYDQYREWKHKNKLKFVLSWLLLAAAAVGFWAFVLGAFPKKAGAEVAERGRVENRLRKPPQKTILEGQVILAIIGEAEDQGIDGMTAVACAIRNRGTLKGVFGLNAPRVRNHKYSLKTYTKALQAWRDSANFDVTHGATDWENVKAFGKPYWAKNMKLTYVCKDHNFYKKGQ